MTSLDGFEAEARDWLAQNSSTAPHDYGAICPPELIDDAIAWQRRLRDAGYAGIHWPSEFGGRGLSPDHQGRWLLACAEAGVPAVLNMVGLVLTGGALLQYGTDEQRERHLRATLGAEQVWCQLFSEPGSGSDLASLTTKAARDRDRFVVNGQKVWCSGGRYSSHGILMARTKPLGEGAERGHIGTTVVALERRLDQMIAVGAERDLSPTRRQDLASLVSTGHAYRAMAQRQGPVAGTAASLTKLGITQMSFDAVMLRGSVAGARSLLDGPDTSGMLSAPGGRIAGGTSEVQRNIIGERLLGLPREPPPRRSATTETT